MKNVNIYAFADEAGALLSQQIAAMKRNGLNGIEIRNTAGINCSDLTEQSAKIIRAELDNAGLTVWSIGSPIGKISIDDDFEAHLEKLKHTIEIAHILGSENIRMFSFYMPKDEDPENYCQKVVDQMGRMLEAAKGTGVDLCHENEKGIYGDIAARCLKLHKALPGLKGVFDPANYIQCGQNTLEGWEMLKDYIKYMHIKDALADGSVVPAGMGEGNVAKIVGDYIARGGKYVTVEPHLKVFAGLEALEKSGDQEARSKIGRFSYPDSDSAFDAACNALKENILK